MERKLFDAKFFKFILVGIVNTLFSMFLMFILYNLFHLGYWGSTAISNVLASALSFVLNKKFTFKNNGSISKTALKFAINVIVCYVVAYSLAQPLVMYLLSSTELSKKAVDMLSMLCGMCFFTLLNYFGQRFFAFR